MFPSPTSSDRMRMMLGRGNEAGVSATEAAAAAARTVMSKEVTVRCMG
jgi:hypothetical protein